ncbi:hypothetical protein Poly24_46070 [Rosistilla carotiformis]|uniref:Uncharacterized protein n=2 Tax=Rosistilla carotiformis TaxID=2528017 RepID=A0A518JZA0_9BACT|nr:hypothetical protein Poly24_46070 [Rosistilla carotiformis]
MTCIFPQRPIGVLLDRVKGARVRACKWSDDTPETNQPAAVNATQVDGAQSWSL